MPGSNRFLCLQTAEFDIESDTDALPSEYAPRSGRFRDFLRLLAQHSDVSVQARQVVASTGSIHLQSEDAPVSDDVLALTTTDALLQMFEAWWMEFKAKDCKSGSSPSKLCSLFRGGGVKVSLKPYESGDGKLSFDPHDAPLSSYQWLPSPSRRLDIDERDFVVFERNTRAPSKFVIPTQ